VLFSGGIFKDNRLKTGSILQLISNQNKKYENKAEFSSVKDKVFLFKFLFPKKLIFPIGSQGILVENFRKSDNLFPEWERIVNSKPLSSRSPRELRSRGESIPSRQQSDRQGTNGGISNGPQQIPSLKFGSKNINGFDKLEFRLDIDQLQKGRRDQPEPESDERASQSVEDTSSRDNRGSESNRGRVPVLRTNPDMGINKITLPKTGMSSGGTGLGLGLPSLNLCKI
jgi:hypothetical protein